MTTNILSADNAERKEVATNGREESRPVADRRTRREASTSRDLDLTEGGQEAPVCSHKDADYLTCNCACNTCGEVDCVCIVGDEDCDPPHPSSCQCPDHWED